MKKGLERNSGIVVGNDGTIFVFRNSTISVKNQYGGIPRIEIDADVLCRSANQTAFLYEVVRDDLLTISEPESEKSKFAYTELSKSKVSRILKSGPYTHVFWADGTKTSVRRAPDEEDNDYAAFTAALAIKMYGSNSALKRMLKDKVEVQKPKEKKATECTDTCPIDYEKIYQDLKPGLSKNDAT